MAYKKNYAGIIDKDLKEYESINASEWIKSLARDQREQIKKDIRKSYRRIK